MNEAEIKTLEIYERIYDIRKKFGRDRQKKHFEDFEALDKNLREHFKKLHPYELTIREKRSLEGQVKNYERGGCGLPAKISADGFLYRLANHIDIYVNTRTVNFLKENVPEKSMQFWHKLHQLSESGKNWLALADHGYISYKTNCGISWWTHDDLDGDDNMIEKANRLGLFENWIGNQIYLLRCRAEMCGECSIASVPTIIDAYTSSVFYTTEDAQDPPEGTTINLSGAPVFELGFSEVVLKEIDLSYLEIKPLVIAEKDRRVFSHVNSNNPRTLESLKSYYESMF